jgi:choice-of-anchor A domain-containing protein
VFALAACGGSSGSAAASGSGGASAGGSETAGAETDRRDDAGSPGVEFAEVCTPNETQLCYGPGACRGAQPCRGDGSGWDPCDCGVDSGGGAGDDATASFGGEVEETAGARGSAGDRGVEVLGGAGGTITGVIGHGGAGLGGLAGSQSEDDAGRGGLGNPAESGGGARALGGAAGAAVSSAGGSSGAAGQPAMLPQECVPAEIVGVNVVVFGNATPRGADCEGPMWVGGNATFSGYSIASAKAKDCDTYSLVVSGDLAGSGNAGNGKIWVGGEYTPSVSFTECQVSREQPGPVDFEALEQKMAAISLAFAEYPPNGMVDDTTASLAFIGNDPELNVFSATAGQIDLAIELAIDVPLSSTVIINVPGEEVVFSGKSFRLPDGASCSGGSTDFCAHIVWNMPEAKTLNVSGIGIQGSVYAPFAVLSGDGGYIDGQLVVKELTGGIEFHPYFFSGCIERRPSLRHLPDQRVRDAPGTVEQRGVAKELGMTRELAFRVVLFTDQGEAMQALAGDCAGGRVVCDVKQATDRRTRLRMILAEIRIDPAVVGSVRDLQQVVDVGLTDPLEAPHVHEHRVEKRAVRRWKLGGSTAFRVVDLALDLLDHAYQLACRRPPRLLIVVAER